MPHAQIDESTLWPIFLHYVKHWINYPCPFLTNSLVPEQVVLSINEDFELNAYTLAGRPVLPELWKRADVEHIQIRSRDFFAPSIAAMHEGADVIADCVTRRRTVYGTNSPAPKFPPPFFFPFCFQGWSQSQRMLSHQESPQPPSAAVCVLLTLVPKCVLLTPLVPKCVLLTL